MSKILLAFAIACPACLQAQFEPGNIAIHGEIHGGAPGVASSLLVEAYNITSHMRAGQALVSSSGSFDLDPLPSGNYELRLITPNGESLRTQFVSARGSSPSVSFELPEQDAHQKAGSGTVDLGQLSHPRDPRALHIFQKAVKAIVRKDHQEAIQLLQKAIEAEPDYGEAHLELSIQYSFTGEADRAYEESQTAARLVPNNPLARLNLAIVLFRMNRLPDAETEARAALRLDPANAKANFLTGAILVGQGKLTSETLGYLRKAYADYPKARELGARLEQRLGS